MPQCKACVCVCVCVGSSISFHVTQGAALSDNCLYCVSCCWLWKQLDSTRGNWPVGLASLQTGQAIESSQLRSNTCPDCVARGSASKSLLASLIKYYYPLVSFYLVIHSLQGYLQKTREMWLNDWQNFLIQKQQPLLDRTNGLSTSVTTLIGVFRSSWSVLKIMQ